MGKPGLRTCPNAQIKKSGHITDIQGFLAVDSGNKILTVSIRGSHTIQNFITDIIFRAEAVDREFCAGCRVHAGFLYAYKEIVARVRAAVADALDKYPSHRVRVTGHSLGGAVATLLGATLRRRGVACDTYTYGAPRVGDEAFVRWLDALDNGRLRRLTHYNDPVPQLPPILFNYRHTSPELWLGGGPVNGNGYLPGDVVECLGSANVKCNAGRSVLPLLFSPLFLVFSVAPFFCLLPLSHLLLTTGANTPPPATTAGAGPSFRTSTTCCPSATAAPGRACSTCRCRTAPTTSTRPTPSWPRGSTCLPSSISSTPRPWMRRGASRRTTRLCTREGMGRRVQGGFVNLFFVILGSKVP